MNSILDNIIAFVIVGMLILLSMQIDANVKTHAIVVRQMHLANSNLSVIGEVIENDLRKIGHGLIAPQKAILLADSSRIIFSYDQDPSSHYDSVRIEYSVRSNPVTPHPADKVLTRKLNSNSLIDMGLGVTRFGLKYYNQAGTNLAVPVLSDSLSKIKVIQVDMTVQTAEAFDGKYQTAVYHTKVTPKNMLIRYGR